VVRKRVRAMVEVLWVMGIAAPCGSSLSLAL